MRYASPQLVEHLAAAYVLGTLAPGARRRFERLRRDRADVSLAVVQWESRLGALAQSVPAVRPSPRVWEAIEWRTRPAQAARARRSWLVTAGWSAGSAVAGMALAVGLFMLAPALFLSADEAAMRTGQKLPQSYVGLLTDAQGNGKLLVSSLRHGQVMTVKAIGPIEAPPPGHRLVLWAVPAEGAAFVLGEAPLKGSLVSRLPDTSEKLLSRVGKLLVSVETSAAPAAPGRVVYAGNCARLW